MLGLGKKPLAILEGAATYKSKTIRWYLFVNDAAFLVNGYGSLVLSCPEMTLGFDWDLRTNTQFDPEEVKVESAGICSMCAPSFVIVSRRLNDAEPGIVWELVAEISVAAA